MRRPVTPRGITAVLLVLLAGCVTEHDGLAGDPLDYEPVGSDGKADGVGATFHRDRVVSDAAFFDTAALDAAAVQAFLEATPYGGRSFLADERVSTGARFSAALVDIARARGLNPLVLLVTVQKEKGLISRTTAPPRHAIDFAFGCGCPDGGSCSSAFRGLDKQLACAADVLGDAADALAGGATTIAGFAPDLPKRVLDGVKVRPANRATAILYTYTPWILPGTGGNWLFWNIWRRYGTALGYAPALTMPFNEGFIGGACSADDECYFEGGLCRDGACSRPCTSACPDRAGGFATTFCAELGDGDFCVARCDDALAAGGCPAGQHCARANRPSDPTVSRDVCLPGP